MSQWDQEIYERLQPYRSRPLQELEKRIGDIPLHIETLLRAGKRPRILEIGHGYGSVLIQLLKRFGSDIELYAVSKEPYWGSWEVIQRNASLMNLASDSELASFQMPQIYVADLNRGLPFSSDYFDFIYSQVSFYLLREKLYFLEECCRVLAPDGSASIDVHPLILPDMVPELSTLLDIRAGQQLIDFWTFIANYPWLSRKQALWEYLQITKYGAPRLEASLRVALNLSDLKSDWFGTKSIYDANSVQAATNG